MGTASGARQLRVRLIRTSAAVIVVTAFGAWGLGMARGDNTSAAEDEPPAPTTSSPASEAPGPVTPRVTRTTRSPKDARSSDAPARTSVPPSPQSIAAPSTSSAPPASPSKSAPPDSSSPTTADPEKSPSDEPSESEGSMIDEILDPVTGAPDD